nr:PASTA domain-containing protein [Agromyces seonyuensis]
MRSPWRSCRPRSRPRGGSRSAAASARASSNRPCGAEGVTGDEGDLVGGRYRLRRRLGSGGTATVHEAFDERMQQLVALKVLHPHLSNSDARRAAFLAEAERIAGLRHPNLAAAFGTGTEVQADGAVRAWIVLERAPGRPLSELVAEQGGLPLGTAIAVLEGTLRGLEAVHLTGLVHRDVSPSNVIVELGGDDVVVGVRLVDFGLSGSAGEAARGRDVLRAATSEDAGVVGNAGYVSPEQARGLPVDERGDVYQAGGVLCFALTGAGPFPRESAAATLEAHRAEQPPTLADRVPGATRELDRVLRRALAKRPDDRFPTAEAFRAALAALAVPAVEATERGDDRPDGADPGDPGNAPGAGALDRTRVLGRTRVHLAAPEESIVLPVGVNRTRQRRVRRARRRGAETAVVLAAVAAVGALVVGASLATPSDVVSPQPAAAPVERPSPSPSASPSPSPSVRSTRAPALASIPVPELAGLALAEARSILVGLGLSVGTVSVEHTEASGDTVLASSPGVDARLPVGATVDLVVASGSNRVPEVRGMSVAAARAVLEDAGFGVEATSAAAGAVVGASRPSAGEVLRLGSVVTLLIAEPTPSAPPVTTSAPVPTSTAAPTAAPTGPPATAPPERGP